MKYQIKVMVKYYNLKYVWSYFTQQQKCKINLNYDEIKDLIKQHL